MGTNLPQHFLRTPEQQARADSAASDLRLLLYEVMRELPVSNSMVAIHADLQRLHRRVIKALGEEDPGAIVRSDYWIGRFPK